MADRNSGVGAGLKPAPTGCRLEYPERVPKDRHDAGSDDKLFHSSSPSIVPRQRRALQKQACSRCAFFVCFSPICKL